MPFESNSITHLSRRSPVKFHDVGGQYTRAGQHGMAYGDRGYLDHQRRAGNPPFGRKPPIDDGSGFGKNLPSGGGYGRYSRPVARAAARLGIGAARANPVGRAVSAAFDIADALGAFDDFASFGEKGEEKWHYEDGYSCASYRRFGPPAVECGYGHHVDGRRLTSAQKCSTWHYQAQAFAAVPPAPTHNFFTAGRLRAGAYGCQRYDYELVVQYPVSALPVTPPWFGAEENTRVAPVVSQTAPPRSVMSETYNGDVENTRPVKPGIPKYAIPSVDIPIRASRVPGSRVKPQDGVHSRRPPNGANYVPAPEKEKKGSVGAKQAMGALGKFYDGVTEIDDIADILTDNIPQCKNVKGLAAQLNCIYDHLGDLDIEGAIGDLIANQAEDRAIGSIHKAGRKAKAPLGSSMFTGYL